MRAGGSRGCGAVHAAFSASDGDPERDAASDQGHDHPGRRSRDHPGPPGRPSARSVVVGRPRRAAGRRCRAGDRRTGHRHPRGHQSAVVSVGEVVVENAPNWLKEFAIEKFGENDKDALIAGTTVTLVVISIVLGILSVRRLWIGIAGTAVLGVVGAWAALTRPLGGFERHLAVGARHRRRDRRPLVPAGSHPSLGDPGGRRRRPGSWLRAPHHRPLGHRGPGRRPRRHRPGSRRCRLRPRRGRRPRCRRARAARHDAPHHRPVPAPRPAGGRTERVRPTEVPDQRRHHRRWCGGGGRRRTTACRGASASTAPATPSSSRRPPPRRPPCPAASTSASPASPPSSPPTATSTGSTPRSSRPRSARRTGA